MNNTIKSIQAHQILDSRGNPTIETEVILKNNIRGRASVPSGASTGEYEAIEMRDEQPSYLGKSVNKAISNIHSIIQPLLLNQNINNIQLIDSLMIQADGTINKKNIGANAMLSVSLACVRAASAHNKQYLFEFINTLYPSPISIPIPMMNILNGGSHADNTVDIQEFMIFPIGIKDFKEALQAGVEIFHTLKKILKKKNYNTNIGDEGGFAPSLQNNEEAIEIILEAIIKAGYQPGKQVFIALDVAASELYNNIDKTYYLKSEDKHFSSNHLIDYYSSLCSKFPIISIEDGLDENNWTGWKNLYSALGDTIQLVGDDLTVTNSDRLKQAITCQTINAILIKLNQIGTFTETMQTINLAKKNNLGIIISHRSGETEDTFIADLAVGCNAGQIKTGSLCRTDRTSKYNQLLRILNTVKNIDYANKSTLGCAKNKK